MFSIVYNVHPCCTISLYVHCWIISYCMYIPHCFYPFITLWAFGLFPLFGYYEQHVLVFVWIKVFCYLKWNKWITYSCRLNILRNYKIVLQSVCTISHPQQQCVRVPVSSSLLTLIIYLLIIVTQWLWTGILL